MHSHQGPYNNWLCLNLRPQTLAAVLVLSVKKGINFSGCNSLPLVNSAALAVAGREERSFYLSSICATLLCSDLKGYRGTRKGVEGDKSKQGALYETNNVSGKEMPGSRKPADKFAGGNCIEGF